ncbi:MAG: hypothetical protein K2N48_12615 [Muribaculaceae bacterium]|nr:hypothetical protein [Muribaculaceae bacterium]
MKKTIRVYAQNLIFLLLSLIFISPLPAGAVKKVEANPINVAVILTEKLDSASIASTLLYYGYIPSSESNPSHKTEDSRLKTEYTHHNGSVIRYSFTKADNGNLYPTIEVTSKASQKEKEQILKNLNFQKNGNAYERRSISHTTRCTNGPRGSLIFQQQPKHGK